MNSRPREGVIVAKSPDGDIVAYQAHTPGARAYHAGVRFFFNPTRPRPIPPLGGLVAMGGLGAGGGEFEKR
jgi:hypothetical protein